MGFEVPPYHHRGVFDFFTALVAGEGIFLAIFYSHDASLYCMAFGCEQRVLFDREAVEQKKRTAQYNAEQKVFHWLPPFVRASEFIKTQIHPVQRFLFLKGG